MCADIQHSMGVKKGAKACRRQRLRLRDETLEEDEAGVEPWVGQTIAWLHSHIEEKALARLWKAEE